MVAGDSQSVGAEGSSRTIADRNTRLSTERQRLSGSSEREVARVMDDECFVSLPVFKTIFNGTLAVNKFFL